MNMQNILFNIKSRNGNTYRQSLDEACAVHYHRADIQNALKSAPVNGIVRVQIGRSKYIYTRTQ